MTDQLSLDALIRTDLESMIAKSFQTLSPGQTFHRGWHLKSLAWHLEQCRKGKIRRLIITIPPRSLKSISASAAFPAFVLGHDPTQRIICVSYSADLAGKQARDCRTIITSPWFQRVFPGTRLGRDKNAELDFVTTRQGFRLSTSVHGTLTGRGANYVIVDDPMKPDEAMSVTRRKSVCEWFDNTVYTRLDDKRSGVIIIVMQRLHLEDLVGHVLAKDEDWTILNLPALAEIDERIQIGDEQFHFRKRGELLHPEREPMEVIDGMRRSLGSFNFAAQYQQSPIPEEGEIIKWKWFKGYETAPRQEGNDQIVQSWDTASKAGQLNDYSVCTTWLVKHDKYYLLDLFRERLLYPELRRAVIAQSKLWKSHAVLIEDKASGMALAQDFRSGELHFGARPIAIEPEGDKITRAATQSVAIEAGQVFLPRGAPFLKELHAEIVQFPNGRYDDQIDSITQFLKWQRRPYDRIEFMKVIGF